MMKTIALLAICFLAMFSLVSLCYAEFTVDYDATTTVMQSIANLHINSLLDHLLLGGIMIMQLLKYFFPKIDGKN